MAIRSYDVLVPDGLGGVMRQRVDETMLDPSAAELNHVDMISKAQTALASNVTYLGLASPSNAQVVAQVRLLTRECSAVIRLLLNALDTTDGT